MSFFGSYPSAHATQSLSIHSISGTGRKPIKKSRWEVLTVKYAYTGNNGKGYARGIKCSGHCDCQSGKYTR